jgi:hypothetical protein
MTQTQVEVLRPGQLAGLDIQSVSDLQPTFNILIYGESGVGKTVLAGSSCVVPEMSPVLLLDVEGGTLSLQKRYPEVDVARIKTWADIVNIYNEIKKAGPNSYYKTIIVDSLTETQNVGMSAIMRRAVKKDEERDPDLPGIGEWGKNTNQMRALIRSFRNCEHINTVFTCLAARDQDKKGNWYTHPALSNKLAREAAGFFDVVLYMYTQDNPNQGGPPLRLLLTQKMKGIVAKDRTDRLPPVVGDENTSPTARLLHGMMFGGEPLTKIPPTNVATLMPDQEAKPKNTEPKTEQQPTFSETETETETETLQ